jgi:hypothetical protein
VLHWPRLFFHEEPSAREGRLGPPCDTPCSIILFSDTPPARPDLRVADSLDAARVA